MRVEIKYSVSKCYGCGNEIDQRWCWCGEKIPEHNYFIGHKPIPQGCTCGFTVEKIENLALDFNAPDGGITK